MIPNPAALENAGNFFHMFYRCDSPLLTIDVQAPTLIMSVTLLAWWKPLGLQWKFNRVCMNALFTLYVSFHQLHYKITNIVLRSSPRSWPYIVVQSTFSNTTAKSSNTSFKKMVAPQLPNLWTSQRVANNAMRLQRWLIMVFLSSDRVRSSHLHSVASYFCWPRSIFISRSFVDLATSCFSSDSKKGRKVLGLMLRWLTSKTVKLEWKKVNDGNLWKLMAKLRSVCYVCCLWPFTCLPFLGGAVQSFLTLG